MASYAFSICLNSDGGADAHGAQLQQRFIGMFGQPKLGIDDKFIEQIVIKLNHSENSSNSNEMKINQKNARIARIPIGLFSKHEIIKQLVTLTTGDNLNGEPLNTKVNLKLSSLDGLFEGHQLNRLYSVMFIHRYESKLRCY